MRKAIRTLVLALALAVLAAGVFHFFRAEDAPRPGGSSASLGLMLLEKEKGLYVLAVTQDSPAEKANFCPGDYLIRADGIALDSVTQLDEMIDAAQQELSVRIRRNGKEMLLHLPAR